MPGSKYREVGKSFRVTPASYSRADKEAAAVAEKILNAMDREEFMTMYRLRVREALERGEI